MGNSWRIPRSRSLSHVPPNSGSNRLRPGFLSVLLSWEGRTRCHGQDQLPRPSPRGRSPRPGGGAQEGRGLGAKGRGPGREGAEPGAGRGGAGRVMARFVAAAAASAAGTEVAAAARVAGHPATLALARPGPAAMEDFIVISDDSGSESSEGTRSSRARRLRRALSRTPGALSRRPVVSERRRGRAASRSSAQSAVPSVPAAHRVAPHGCSRFPPRSSAAGRERGPQAFGSRGGWRAVAGHMGDVQARPVRGALEPTASGGLRPGRGLARASAAVGAGGLGGQGVLVGSPRPRGPDAGTCNCLACAGYRCVQGGNGSPGWAGGYEGRALRAWARWWPRSRAWQPSEGPDFGVVQEAIYIA